MKTFIKQARVLPNHNQIQLENIQNYSKSNKFEMYFLFLFQVYIKIFFRVLVKMSLLKIQDTCTYST